MSIDKSLSHHNYLANSFVSLTDLVLIDNLPQNTDEIQGNEKKNI